MYKEIVTPTVENHTFEIPEEFYGKEVVLKIEDNNPNIDTIKAGNELLKEAKHLTFNSQGKIKYDRNTSTDYGR